MHRGKNTEDTEKNGERKAAEGSLHCGPHTTRASGRDDIETIRPRNGLVLRGRLHDDGVGVFYVRIVNLIGVKLQVAFQLQIQR